MQTYQGWTNSETWNTSLWILNKYGLYKNIMRLYRGSRNEGDFADNIEHFINIIWNEKTPDGYNLNPVNWMEISDSWYYENSA
tara:strand:- start:1417 stop:1665 length:249 start_codon:yes stop_codon:yes gene_type:complete